MTDYDKIIRELGTLDCGEEAAEIIVDARDAIDALRKERDEAFQQYVEIGRAHV